MPNICLQPCPCNSSCLSPPSRFSLNKALTFHSLCLNTFGGVPIVYRMHYKFSSWMPTVWPNQIALSSGQLGKHVLLCTRHWARCKNYWTWFFITLLLIIYTSSLYIFYPPELVAHGLLLKSFNYVSPMDLHCSRVYPWLISEQSRPWISHRWIPSSPSDDSSMCLSLW